ncbi:hypothetical protein ABW20_dc0109357 [Dactylellina cionopaga]|nr:hypothetical protein ABW20_dc0109357 [Dactylellina cionopaga]
MSTPPGADGTYGWPIYVQGGTSHNPQFAYYPIPTGNLPSGIPRSHRRRPAKVDDDDDDEKASLAPVPNVLVHHLLLVFAPPPIAPQQTTFIPYAVPAGTHCKFHCKAKTNSDSTNSNDKKHQRKNSTSASSYQYASSCDCASCKARRMAAELERIKEERQRDRDYKDAKEFLRMKERVDREDREVEMEEEYRSTKRAAEMVERDARMYHRMHREPEEEEEYEWAAVPITAFHPGHSTPVILEPINPGGHRGGRMTNLEEENCKLRHQKDHLKGKVQRERSLRNIEANRASLSTRLQDLDQDVQDLKRKVRSTRIDQGGQTPVVEIQVPVLHNKHHHSHTKSSSSTPKSKVKDSSRDTTQSKNSSDQFTFKKKTLASKHRQPHICYDSDCADYDSCSDCDFECEVKGCKTCRPRGGRR